MEKLFILLFLFPIALSAQKDTICFVNGAIPLIKQPKPMDCWITVTTMMFSWKEGKDYSLEEMSNRVGEPWNSYFKNNKGLNFQEQDVYVKKIGLKGEPPANYTLEAYITFLKKYGPLWITTGNGFSAHARLLIGITGDGSYNLSTFIFINPYSGKVEEQNALEFVHEFEEEAYAANELDWEKFRIQIYHF